MAEDASGKSTAELVARQGELAVRLGKLGKEVTKCATELEAITKELEQRVANDSAIDGEHEQNEDATDAPAARAAAASGEKKAGSAKTGDKDKRDLAYYTSTKTTNTQLREAANKERQNINKPRPAVREFKHW